MGKENKGRKQGQVILAAPDGDCAPAPPLQVGACRLYPPNSPGMAAGSWAPGIKLGTVVTVHSVTASAVLGGIENSHNVKLRRF